MKKESVIAANRFGLGARPGELSMIEGDPAGWLLGQLSGPGAVPPAVGVLPKTSSILLEVNEVRQMQRDARKAPSDQPAPNVVKKFGAIARRHYLEQTEARYCNAAATDFPFHERLVHFWSNHFAVSADKPPITALAGSLAASLDTALQRHGSPRALRALRQAREKAK